MTELFLTAEEAYPAFETLVAEAQSEVAISMRIFDPATRLRAATGIGDSWADLIAHKLGQGVRFDITITDFDPVARPAMHRYSWQCLAALRKAASAHPDLMRARVHMHPAEVSWVHRLVLRAMSRSKINEECDRLNALDPEQRARQLAAMPAFRKLITGRDRLRAKRWPPATLHPATHHQKMAVIDGAALYIGGLDLNPRRYDTLEHRQAADQTWHDVQLIRRGPVARVARDHIAQFVAQTEGKTVPPKAPGLLRTLSRRHRLVARHLAPRQVLHELETAHIEMIGAARDFIYIETQFLRASAIADALVRQADKGVDLIVLLPAAPEDVAFDGSSSLDARFGEHLQAKSVARLQSAFGDRLFLGAPARPVSQSASPSTSPGNSRTALGAKPGPGAKPGHSDRDTMQGAPIIYIHAKVLVVDGKQGIVSSANLNGRSMRWDTETGVALDAPEAAHLFRRSCAHWFRDAVPAAPQRARTWQQEADKNAALAPQNRPHFVLPYDPDPARELGQPMPGLPEELA